ITSVPRGKAVFASGEFNAGDEALEIPFPWPGQRLVEIVGVEHQIAFGSPKETEVLQMRVAAQLRANAGRRRGREVSSHHHGRAANKCKGRLSHAPVANRKQLRKPRLRLLLEQLQRIPPVRERKIGVCRTWNVGPGRLAACDAL